MTHAFNHRNKLNDPLQKLAIKTKTIHAEADNTLDFDNVILDNEKSDSAKTYKMTTGYQPALAFIGRQVVFIEGRGGNTPAAYKMQQTLTACFQSLNSNGIHIEHFRSDIAAYQQSVVEVVENNCTHFYIRTDDFQNLRDAIKDIPETDWKPILIINNKKAEVADTPFQPFGAKNMPSVVQHRKKRRTIF